jgi:uncharacterized protein YutE (UPF0331/DUF86 family)
MRLDLYQSECERIARQQQTVLDQVAVRLRAGESLSLLEQGGVLHALQVLVENAIGKCKHWLKAHKLAIPVSAYDAFFELHSRGFIDAMALNEWNAAIGLRNRIVQNYMNIDAALVNELVLAGKHPFIADFLVRPIEPMTH